MTHACNPSTLGGQGGRIMRWEVWDHSGQHGETPSLLKTYTKNNRLLWHTPMIPATQEAEGEELLELGRLRLQWAEMFPLHSSLGNRVRLRLKKKKNLPSLQPFSRNLLKDTLLQNEGVNEEREERGMQGQVIHHEVIRTSRTSGNQS